MKKRIKSTNKHDQLLERDIVKILVNQLDAMTGFSIFSKVDVDSPARMFKGGYDFYMTGNGKINFIEAKRVVEKVKPSQDTSEKLFKSMTESERSFAIRCYQCKTPYYLLNFFREDFVKKFDLNENIKSSLYILETPVKDGIIRFNFSNVLFRKTIDKTAKFLVGLLK